MVKINIAYPPYGSSQLIEVDDEKKWRVFLDKRMSEEVPADSLGDEFKGYVFKITGGYDKQGFAMMQGVMLNHRTRLLLDGRTGMYTPKRNGCRKRKSVRGCIIAGDMSCINVIITKRGPADLPKLTDKASDRPSVRGPKRAANIRKAWGLTKKDDVRQYVIKKTKPGKDGKDRIKSPKIQRLITPVVKQRRKRLEKAYRQQREKSRKDAADYAKLLMQLRNEKRSALLSKRRELKSKASTTKDAKKPEEKDKKPVKRVMKNKKAIALLKAQKKAERKKGIKKPTTVTEKKAQPTTGKKAQPTQTKTTASTGKTTASTGKTTASTGKKATATKSTKK